MKCKRCGSKKFFISGYDVVCANCNLVVASLSKNKVYALVKNGEARNHG